MEVVNFKTVGMGGSHLVSVKTNFHVADLRRLRKTIDNHLDFADAVTFALLGASENIAVDRCWTDFRTNYQKTLDFLQ